MKKLLNIKISKSLFVILIMIISSAIAPSPYTKHAFATTETFTTAVSTTWVAPSGVTSVDVECWGAGGGAGGGVTSGGGGGYGGGGGAYAKKTIAVTPGNSYSYTVGALGAGGGALGGTGGDSTFTGDSSVQCVADGGTGGTDGFGGSRGLGGTIANSDGTIEFAGGNGAFPSGNTGGGGGGSGGSAAGGNSGGAPAGATAVTDGGPGGDGGAVFGASGSAPVSGPGGGGGAGGGRSGGPEAGGDGFDGQIRLTYTAATTITIGDGTDPSNTTIGPGSSATVIDGFTLQRSTGQDSVTAYEVTLGPANAYQNIETVKIETSGGAAECETSTISSNVVSVTGCLTPVDTILTNYRISIVPKSHANMPAVPGASYGVTATVTNITTSTTVTGTDTDSATITVDNLSPGNVTSSSVSAGSSQNSLAWTNPGDSDYSSTLVLRSTASVSDVPVEGSTYATTTAIGSSVVACVGRQVSCIDTSLTPGTPYHYKIFTLDSAGNYSATGVVPTGSPVTPYTVPTVTTQSASSVGQTSATLNGNITATGGTNATVRGFAWGTNSSLSGGDTATTTENGSFGTGAFTNSSLTLVCNTTYYSRAYATNPGGTSFGSISASFTTSACSVTTLSDGTDGGNSTIAPGASATEIDRFSLVTNTGTDTVTGLTITLGPANAFNNIATVGVYTTGDVLKCSATPSSNSVSLSSCGIAVNTTPTQYIVKITPKTHANMAAPATGVSYATVATAGTLVMQSGSSSGTDTDSATITVDNLSPGNVSGAAVSSGNTQNGLAWTNPVDSDYSSTLVLRRASSAVSDVPVEGSTYATTTAIGSSVVACVGNQTSCTDTSLSNGTAYHYKIFALDSRGNYSDAGVVPTGSPATPATLPTVTTSAASSVGQTSATLNGNITATGGANATVRGFAWGTSSSMVGDTATTTENGSFSTGTFTNSSLTLVCNTTYYSRAYATNSAGTGYGAISASFTTSACAPTVTTQSASSVGQTSATLNGNITATGGSSATVRGFAWGTSSSMVGDTATTTENGTFSTGAFTDSSLTLVCNTTYYSRAYATNSAGTSYGSISASFTTTSCPAAPSSNSRAHGGGNQNVGGETTGSGAQTTGGGAGGAATTTPGGEGTGSGGQNTGGGAGGGTGDLGFLQTKMFALLSKLFFVSDYKFSLVDIFRLR
jgi:hypothetical protein